jgi:hypothetical protein
VGKVTFKSNADKKRKDEFLFYSKNNANNALDDDLFFKYRRESIICW